MQHFQTRPTEQQTPGSGSAPCAVHTLLAEHHQAEASRARHEAARLIRRAPDLNISEDTTALKRQVSAALLLLAEARENLARNLHARP